MRSGLIFGGLAAFGILLLVAFGFDLFSPSDTNRLRNDPQIMDGLVNPAIKQGATPDYIDALLTVRSNGVPTQRALAAIGPMIDQRFGAVPGHTGEYNRAFTLLDHALDWRNVAAVTALLDAGADPHTSANSFIDAASAGENGRPDWVGALKFTRLYLAYGGNVDYANLTDAQPMFVQAAYKGNYEAAKLLLESGADPWIEMRGVTAEHQPVGRDKYALLSVPFGRAEGTRFLIWFQDAGYLDDAPSQMVEMFYDGYLDDITLITTDQTTMADEMIASIRDLLEQGLDIAPDYRAAERTEAIAALTRYIQE